MKNKKVLAAGLAFCVSLQGLASCAEEERSEDVRAQIGVACYDQDDIFISELLECVEDELGLLKDDSFQAAVTVRDGAGSQKIQNDQVEELINAGCDILCVNLVDRADPSEIIDLARENEVPIIFFNREPVAEDMLQWEKLYYVGADAKQSGIMQGELAADAIKENPQIDRNKDGKIQYVVLGCHHPDGKRCGDSERAGSGAGEAQLRNRELEQSPGGKPYASDDQPAPESDRAGPG